MSEKVNNPLDDDLLKELGLEPRDEGEAPDEGDLLDNDIISPEVEASPEPQTKPEPAAPPVSEPSHQDTNQTFEKDVKKLALNMPVQIVAVLGKKTMTLKDIVALKQGEVMELGKHPHELIDLVANGKLVARGELVLIDGKTGIQIKQIV